MHFLELFCMGDLPLLHLFILSIIYLYQYLVSFLIFVQ